ncbi:helix-turn-helix domain-containing protein [Streptomyces sp. NPDC088254]|uniref:helix-turn-helix domain-containing protein n=1 Tax=Streptomyces sp. NPDC088254 TaxID=3365847 RepID=UPI0037FD8F1B
MWHPQGGLTAERQQFREELRPKAAERFARGEASSVIAKDLRVGVRSVQRWRQLWDEDGPRALRSQGPASLPRLSEKQFAQLEAELAKGPAAHGWEDQRWTLSRVKTVIGRRFHPGRRAHAADHGHAVLDAHGGSPKAIYPRVWSAWPPSGRPRRLSRDHEGASGRRVRPLRHLPATE